MWTVVTLSVRDVEGNADVQLLVTRDDGIVSVESDGIGASLSLR
jgi:hypothetical protein